MATILDGKKIAAKRMEILREEIRNSGLHPTLATVIVGSDPASQMYVRMKHRACGQAGIGSVSIDLPGDATTERVLTTIAELNSNAEIDGILVQLPLPGQVETRRIIAAVDPGKDVDGFHPFNLGKLFSGLPEFIPCTPGGIMTLLSEYDIDVSGRQAVVAGRSIEVGRPMAALLLNADATVTVCHSRTSDLAAELRRAEILITAIGKAHYITDSMVRPGAVVIDVGINHLDGKVVGDVDFEQVRHTASAITPVPGGVGPMTIATLLENTCRAAHVRSCAPAP